VERLAIGRHRNGAFEPIDRNLGMHATKPFSRGGHRVRHFISALAGGWWLVGLLKAHRRPCGQGGFLNKHVKGSFK
jgi:hypothetical protein